MSFMPLPTPPTEQIRQRLDARTHLLSRASDAEFAKLSFIFAQAEYLGQLLHATRECLEAATLDHGPTVNPALPDGASLFLWERGLALPEEVDAGLVTALVRWYVDQLRHQRQETTESRLARDIIALFSELRGDDPMDMLDAAE